MLSIDSYNFLWYIKKSSMFVNDDGKGGTGSLRR